MIDAPIQSCLDDMLARRREDGGVSDRPNGVHRPDAAAWAALALAPSDDNSFRVRSILDRLTEDQQPDGSVPVTPAHQDAVWPTPLAVLAWHDSPTHRSAYTRATQFLLGRYGHHWTADPDTDDAAVRHDPAIHGWPWIANTHSWVPPTALTVVALALAGYGDHERVHEGTHLLLDRQLPHGGWNYGNTFVWGKELRPFPETTGAALCALTTRAPQSAVQPSIDYLLAEFPTLRTPLSLGWASLGLAAWDIDVPAHATRLEQCLALQDRYGSYTTSALGLMVSAWRGAQGIPDRLLASSHTLAAAATQH